MPPFGPATSSGRLIALTASNVGSGASKYAGWLTTGSLSTDPVSSLMPSIGTPVTGTGTDPGGCDLTAL
jgi:hypothetical protein